MLFVIIIDYNFFFDLKRLVIRVILVNRESWRVPHVGQKISLFPEHLNMTIYIYIYLSLSLLAMPVWACGLLYITVDIIK